MLYKRSVGPGLLHLIKALTVDSDKFLDQTCWLFSVNLPPFASPFDVSLQQHLFSPLQWMKPLFVVVQAASYCLCHGCFVLPRPTAPTEESVCVGRGGFIKAGARWTQQQWIKVFCMIKSLPRGGINLICERMLLRGNKVPKSSVILFVMS